MAYPEVKKEDYEERFSNRSRLLIEASDLLKVRESFLKSGNTIPFPQSDLFSKELIVIVNLDQYLISEAHVLDIYELIFQPTSERLVLTFITLDKLDGLKAALSKPIYMVPKV